MNPYEATNDEGLDANGGAIRTWELRHIGPMSAFRVLAGLYGGLAAVLGLLYGAGMTLGAVFMAAEGEPAALGLLLGAVAAVILFPLLYGIIGGVVGALMAFLYNFAAGRMGGLEMGFAERDG